MVDPKSPNPGLCSRPAEGETEQRTRAPENSVFEAEIGFGCELAGNVSIQGLVRVGNRVQIGRGTSLNGPLTIQDDVVIGQNVILGSPGEKIGATVAQTTVWQGATIQDCAEIISGVTIGEQAIVGASTKVSVSVPAYGCVGLEKSQVSRTGVVPTFAPGEPPRVSKMKNLAFNVAGVRIIPLTSATDLRGFLVAGEFPAHFPFQPQRFFMVMNVPPGERRGIHAHRDCFQVMVALQGEVCAVVADGSGTTELLLDTPSQALLIPPLTWGTQHSFSSDAILLVIASNPYDPADYLHHWDKFMEVVQEGVRPGLQA